MSGPYVYTPPAFQPTPYTGSYGEYSQQQPHSPFIPPANLFSQSPYPPSSPYQRPSSPYARPPSPYTQPSGSPYTGSAPWQQSGYGQHSYYNQPPLQPRSRRPSWHGTGLPPSPSTLGVPLPSPSHSRRRSFGNSPVRSPWDSYAMPWNYNTAVLSVQVHPLLDGEAFPQDFVLDLAQPRCTPIRVYAPGQSQVLPYESLQVQGTYPPLTRMRITHDRIPMWPIDLEFQAEYASTQYGAQADPTPITVYDVLFAVHQSLHTPIRQVDWAHLSRTEETDIARAYTRRCKLVPSEAAFQSSQGVKRIDYLLDRTYFHGIIKAPDVDGFYHFRLLT